MAMYTQVGNTAGYVGLNALEYIMQTVSNLSFRDASTDNHFHSTLMPCFMIRHLRYLTQLTVVMPAACFLI